MPRPKRLVATRILCEERGSVSEEIDGKVDKRNARLSICGKRSMAVGVTGNGADRLLDLPLENLLCPRALAATRKEFSKRRLYQPRAYEGGRC